jgi:hypothetical protein
MGCCNRKFSKETLLQNFWSNLPIRRIFLQDFTKHVLSINELTKKTYDDIMQKYIYPLQEDEINLITCRHLFDDLFIKQGPGLVIFCISLLTKLNPDNDTNIHNIRQLSDHLRLRIIEYEDSNHFITEIMLKKVYYSYISMISNNCVEPIFNNYYEDDSELREYKLQLHSYFQDHIIDVIVTYIIEVNDIANEHIVSLDDYIKNIEIIQNDEVIRKILEEAHSNEAKFIKVNVRRPLTAREKNPIMLKENLFN